MNSLKDELTFSLLFFKIFSQSKMGNIINLFFSKSYNVYCFRIWRNTSTIAYKNMLKEHRITKIYTFYSVSSLFPSSYMQFSVHTNWHEIKTLPLYNQAGHKRLPQQRNSFVVYYMVLILHFYLYIHRIIHCHT